MGFFNNLFGNTKKESTNLNTLLNTSIESKFARDIFTRQLRSIHQEKELCKQYYRENSLVHTSIETMSDLIKGDSFIIDTDKRTIKDFIEKNIFYIKGFVEALDVAVREALITGDGYIEKVKDNKGRVIKYLPIPNSEDIYIDYDYNKDKVIRYIQRVLTRGIKKNLVKNAKTFTIYTLHGAVSVYGIEIPADKLIHIKYGVNSWGVYGRSDIASVLDDLRILETIERSIAVISKYRAIPKKALYIEKREGEPPLSKEEAELISRTLMNLKDYENPVINRKLGTIDLSFGGSEINLASYIDYLKRKITVCMAPEFLIHGEDVNRATSREQKQTYFLRIASKRYPIEKTITEELKRDINSIGNPELIGDFSFRFGEFDIMLPEEREELIIKKWQAGLITLAEARKELGLDDVEGTDMFSFETNMLSGYSENEEE